MLEKQFTFLDFVTASRKSFFFFLEKCNEYYRLGDDLRLYQKLIQEHRRTTDLTQLISDPEFIRLLYRTLEKWNMNQRAAKLNSLDNLQNSILEHKQQLIELYRYKILAIRFSDFEKIIELIENVFCTLHVMDSKRKIVGVSKALHFLLPDLVMPIDSKYTLPGFYGDNVYHNNPLVEFAVYKDILLKSYQIFKELEINENDVDGEKWNTSAPKLIDNALIGTYKYIEKLGFEKFKETVKKAFIINN